MEETHRVLTSKPQERFYEQVWARHSLEQCEPPRRGDLPAPQPGEHLGQDRISIYQLMLLVSFTQEPVACLLPLRLRQIYRHTGDHLSMGVQGKIPCGVFKKGRLVRISNMFPTLCQCRGMASLSQLSQ